MPQPTYPQSPVETVVRAASRRRHGLLILQQCSYAVTAILSGAILMLLLGTEILHWYWWFLLGAVGLAVGALRLRGQFLTNYEVAQTLDQRLRLADTLSTAWFLLTASSRHNVPSQLQLRQAEQLAVSIQPNAAFPFQGKRTWTVTALLLVIACGLFAIRYLASDHLAFQQPMIPLHFGNTSAQLADGKLPPAEQRPERVRSRKEQNRYDVADKTPVDPDNKVSERGESKSSTGENTNPQASPSHDQRDASHESRDHRGSEQSHQSSRAADASDQPDASKSANQQQSADNSSPNNSFKPNKNEQQRTDTSQEPSLTTKLRDALSGLLQKMHGGSDPSRAGQEGPQSNGTKSTKNQMTPDRDPQASAEENGNGKTADANASQSQAQQAQASAANASASQREGTDRSAGQRSPDSHSAAGRQDGSKETREAEQLKAMGKLAEILGKRSNDVSGEMSVETSSGKQQLQTPLTQKIGQHAGLGGEINHNQVPLDDQQYVRDYMKQVHQEPNGK